MVRKVLTAALLSVLVGDVVAQRTNENAVTQSDDAFGTTIGDETIGLYSNSQVRGFSPVDAGNIRLEGLYFDRRGSLSTRLVESSKIRVGISAQSYPFPAPTGIVDYRLRKPGSTSVLSIESSLNAYGGPSIEIDGSTPIIQNVFSVGGGISYSHEEYYDGADADYLRASFIPTWQVSKSTDITAFGSYIRGRDEEVAPTIVTGGSWLPPEIERRKYFGQSWADNETQIVDYGIIANSKIDTHWSLAAGIFHTENKAPSGFAEIYDNTTREGITRELLIADPEQSYVSTSGEFRLTGSFVRGNVIHRVHGMIRGREQENLYGGSAPAMDLGVRQLPQRRPVPEPESFAFSERSQDLVSQWAMGVGYEGRWQSVGELSLGVQYNDYEKEVNQPQTPLTKTTDTPVLFSATIAAYLNDTLALYAGHTNGLEESGVAPDNSTNRNQALPTIRTQQTDAGIRWDLSSSVKLVVGAFDVKKPYFTNDSSNRYTEAGSVRHKGFELSLSGSLSKQWYVVAGAVLMQPEIEGYDVDVGRLSNKPVGQTDQLVRTNIEYHPTWWSALSLDFSVSYFGDRVASNDGLSVVPAYTLFDLGARYRFNIGDAPSLLRFKVVNATDVFTWKVYSSNSFGLTDERHFTLHWTVDL